MANNNDEYEPVRELLYPIQEQTGGYPGMIGTFPDLKADSLGRMMRGEIQFPPFFHTVAFLQHCGISDDRIQEAVSRVKKWENLKVISKKECSELPDDELFRLGRMNRDAFRALLKGIDKREYADEFGKRGKRLLELVRMNAYFSETDTHFIIDGISFDTAQKRAFIIALVAEDHEENVAKTGDDKSVLVRYGCMLSKKGLERMMNVYRPAWSALDDIYIEDSQSDEPKTEMFNLAMVFDVF